MSVLWSLLNASSHCAVYAVVDRIRLSEPQSPGTAWFLDQLISTSTVAKLLFDLLTDSTVMVSHGHQYHVSASLPIAECQLFSRDVLHDGEKFLRSHTRCAVAPALC